MRFETKAIWVGQTADQATGATLVWIGTPTNPLLRYLI
jgi:hypothetical protein